MSRVRSVVLPLASSTDGPPAQVRAAQSSLHSLRQLVQDYATTSEAKRQELDAANERFEQLRSAREITAREIAAKNKCILRLEEKCRKWTQTHQNSLAKIEALNKKLESQAREMNAQEEKLIMFRELKDVMRKALGLNDDATDEV